MNRKKILEKRLSRLQKKMQDLAQRALASNDANEVRSINAQMEDLKADIDETQEEIDAIAAESAENNGEEGEGVQRQAVPPTAEIRGGNPLAAFLQNPAGAQTRENPDPYNTLEYRQAFKVYVQTGTPIPAELRAGGDSGTTLTAELGMIIPTKIMNEFIKGVSKVYGQVYSKVRKLNVKGGVDFPISKLTANFKWITETSVSEKQKAGDINEKVSFSYYIGEIRVAETLLAQVVSLDIFESEISCIMVEAYVKAMDDAIINGDGNGKPWGLTKDPRVKNVVEFTEAEIGDWIAWRKNLFAKIPLSKRGTGEFLFPNSTVESQLLTMKDANNRPLFREATEGTIGNLAGTFFGRQVTLVEPDIIKDFDTATAGDIIGVYWVPRDYAINTNMAFGMKRYFDEDTNEWINKGLTIVDGKILDTSGCYLIKKKASK